MKLSIALLLRLFPILLVVPLSLLHAEDAPSAQTRGNQRMLAGDWLPEDPHQIDYEKLPRVPAEHAIISDVRDRAGTRVHQHAYLAHHDGRYWAMWSDGPGVPRVGASAERHWNIVPGHDRADTRNSFATSVDGLHWSEPADLTGPPRKPGYGWIARGLWKRDGELLALSSHFNAPGYSGLGLSLEAFRWNGTGWEPHGTVLDDSMNNFPPKRLPSGEWMMTRRDHRRQVSVMIGGNKAFDDWRINPLAAYDGNGRPEEPYWYILPDDKTLVGLIRDNGGSKFLLRTYSRDNGKTWSDIERTNFPDATSKFFVHRTSRGYYVMVSNSNPRRRDPLTLAISRDGVVFTKRFWLIGGRHIDYPHIIEHDGHLLVAFSGAKQTMEVMKVSLDDLEALIMPESVELDEHLPAVRPQPQQPPERPTLPSWIDLGDEGSPLYAVADLVTPKRGAAAEFSLATSGGHERVVIGVDVAGRLTGRLYKYQVSGPELEPGSQHSLLVRVQSHREKPDELFVQLGPPNTIPAEPKEWTLVNQAGSSDADLSRALLHSDSDSSGFKNIRVATTREALAKANVIAGEAPDADVIVYGPGHENIKLCRDGYYAEPSVSEAVFESMLAAEKDRIRVIKGWRLSEAHVSDDTLTSITIMQKGEAATRRLFGKVFIDATYEGDLYAAAGAEYRLGRESRDEFDEPHAGVVYFDDLKAGRLAGPKVLKPGRGYNPLHFDTLVRALSVTDIPNQKTDVNMNPRPLANELHFPKDEFTDDKDHFPFQLYVREGRRLVGEITLTEHHITGNGQAITHHPDTVAIGEFPIDSFPCRKRQSGDTIVLEGYLGMLDHITRPYEIPYRVMVPKKVDGLIVPVAASTTHVAFSSIRIEPTWMALGQAAGTAAHMAIKEDVQPRAVPIKSLQATLEENGQVLRW